MTSTAKANTNTDPSTIHSLPSDQPIPTKKPAQLPLPSSNFSASRSQPLPSSLPSPTRQSTSRPYGRSSTSVWPNPSLPIGGDRDRERERERERAGDHPQPLTSSPTANMTTFQQQHNPNSTTHAGGIQPSANFFRPLRAYQFSRPSSSGSAESSANGLAIMAPDPGLFQLQPISPRRSHSSENLSGSTHAPASIAPESIGAHGAPQAEIKNLNEEELRRQFSAPKRMKHSREPLLPIGGKPLSTINTNTSVPASAPPSSQTFVTLGMSQRNVVKQEKSSPILPLSAGPTKRMRNSIERAFRRGISFDSTHKSSTSVATPSEARHTFEGKQPTDDDERNIFPISNHHYKGSSSPPPPFTHDLNISASQLPLSPSPDHSYISTPPKHNPPLSAVPVRSPKGHIMRNYESHPSRNKFFIRGRFLTGGDSPWAFIASLGLTLGITGVWFGTTCVWWWKNESPAVAAVGAYLCLITVTTMLTTAMRDPGILPRNLDLDPPYPTTSSDGSRVPLPRDLKVRQDIVRVKYCPTCRTYRPPRSSHCKMCDNCVDGCDHHCQWVNNCVGRRNYTSFFSFLFAAVITLILVIVTAALHIYFLAVRENLDFRGAIVHGLGSTISFCLAVMVVWPVAALLSYHMRLLLLNVTTIEQIRNSAHKTLVPGAATPPNPFSHGTWRRNLSEVLCRPAGASWLDGRGIKTEDKRQVNPGMEMRDIERGLGPRWDRHDNDE